MLLVMVDAYIYSREECSAVMYVDCIWGTLRIAVEVLLVDWRKLMMMRNRWCVVVSGVRDKKDKIFFPRACAKM